MRVEYINPFVRSLCRVFETMLNCPLKRGALQLKADAAPLHEISGLIGLSGNAVGSVVVSFSRDVALKAASTLLMSEATELDADVTDAIGEIANMVAGAAKAELAEFELSISLPNVIVGAKHGIHFPSSARPICVPFSSPWGPLTLEVSLEELPSRAATPTGETALAQV